MLAVTWILYVQILIETLKTLGPTNLVLWQAMHLSPHVQSIVTEISKLPVQKVENDFV